MSEIFKIVLFVAVICGESQQNILIKSFDSRYDLKLAYGNVTKDADNETHFGKVTFYMSKKISSFDFVMMLKSGEKVVMNRTKSPCENKANRSKVGQMMSVMFDKSMNADEIRPFLYRCPIQKGLSTIPPRSKDITFPMMVPSFLATPGAYQWMEIYTAISNGKMEAFLTLSKQLTIIML